MIGNRLQHIVSIVLLVTVSAGFTAAHDTGSPHTHDSVSDHIGAFLNGDHAETFAVNSHLGHGVQTGSAPVAFLIIPITGEFFPFHWLWHTMNGENADDRIHLVHEIMHWYDLPHPHAADVVEGGDQPADLAQAD